MAVKRVVGFSGGIDSQACALWVRENCPITEIVLLFADTGWEDCITYEFVRRYSENVFPVQTVTPLIGDSDELVTKAVGLERGGLGPNDVLTMERLAVIKGMFAYPRASWCTTHLKLYPVKRWIRENLIAHDPSVEVIHYVGIRKDESRARSKFVETEWDDFLDCQVMRPVLTWSKAQCFEYVTSRCEEYNPLYKMGQSRVGCSPCHQRSKEDIRTWAAYRPDEIEKVRQAEKRTGKTFMPPVVPGMTVNFIDDVIAWSRTAYGGKRLDLPIVEMEAEAGQCSSKYGLCE